jgi:NSS family neurotransmitter:Na+ symporter
LSECVLIGWVFGARRIREHINENSKMHLGWWFDVLIKFIIPGLLLYVLGLSVWGEFQGGLYGMDFGENYSERYQFMSSAPIVVFVVWFLTCAIGGMILTKKGEFRDHV